MDHKYFFFLPWHRRAVIHEESITSLILICLSDMTGTRGYLQHVREQILYCDAMCLIISVCSDNLRRNEWAFYNTTNVHWDSVRARFLNKVAYCSFERTQSAGHALDDVLILWQSLTTLDLLPIINYSSINFLNNTSGNKTSSPRLKNAMQKDARGRNQYLKGRQTCMGERYMEAPKLLKCTVR